MYGDGTGGGHGNVVVYTSVVGNQSAVSASPFVEVEVGFAIAVRTLAQVAGARDLQSAAFRGGIDYHKVVAVGAVVAVDTAIVTDNGGTGGQCVASGDTHVHDTGGDEERTGPFTLRIAAVGLYVEIVGFQVGQARHREGGGIGVDSNASLSNGETNRAILDVPCGSVTKFVPSKRHTLVGNIRGAEIHRCHTGGTLLQKNVVNVVAAAITVGDSESDVFPVSTVVDQRNDLHGVSIAIQL